MTALLTMITVRTAIRWLAAAAVGVTAARARPSLVAALARRPPRP